MAYETLSHNLLDPASPFASFGQWPDWLPREPLTLERLLTDKGLRAKLRGLRGSIDLVAGGPPCQGFSVGGARRVQDPRNDLPKQFVAAVDVLRPRVVLMENVEGFDRPFTSAGRRTSHAEVARDDLRRLGYSTAKLTVRAEDYGVPQLRRRVIIVGFAEPVDEDVLLDSVDVFLRQASWRAKTVLLPETRFPVSIGEAIADLLGDDLVPSPDGKRFQTRTYGPPRSEYARFMRGDASGLVVPDSHRIPLHTEKLSTFFKRAQQSGFSGRLPRRFLIDNGIMSRKKFLLDPEAPASTITSHPDEFIHYREPRIMTLREAARIQSFPDAFAFKGRYTLNGDRRGLDVSRCAQIGNAIPPLMAWALGAAVRSILDSTATTLREVATESRAQSPSRQLALAI